MNQPFVTMMPDGKRLHCQYGPIDLIIEARGDAAAVGRAYAAAQHTFNPILQQLVDELPLLRTPLHLIDREPGGPVARRMMRAVRRVRPNLFVTPMAAVAGSVADHMLAAMTEVGGLTQAYVNNGGDIALWLDAGESFRIAMCDDPINATLAGQLSISPEDQIGGVATSGWRGRSLSLGIADAVTVTARCSADADVAATLIANSVDLPGHPGIERTRANDIDPNSDLNDQLVTVGVGSLSETDVKQALARGESLAASLIDQQLISSAALSLRGQVQVCGAGQELLEQAHVLC
jgi:ApbE superfamily uncharacterized protein (UPF0280 family)